MYERYENEYADDYDSDDFQVRERNYVIHDDEPNEPYFPDEDELDVESFTRDLGVMQTQMINMLSTKHDTPAQKPAPSVVAKTAKDSEDACFVCFTNVPDAMFPQCGHAGLCCVCADKIVKTTQKCPLCRKAAASFAPAQGGDLWKNAKKESESDAWLDE